MAISNYIRKIKNKVFTKQVLKFLIFLAIFISGYYLRTYNEKWDDGIHLNPDERYMTMVIDAIRMPNNLQEYFDPQTSRFSPYNANNKGYVYGTVPLHIVKIVGVITGNDNYGDILEVGRLVSAFFDSLTLLLVFQISKKIFKDELFVFFSFASYAFCALAIQASHYFTVDSFLTFFITLDIFLIVNFLKSKSFRSNLIFTLLMGLVSALAIGCKMSAVTILPVVLLAIWYKLLKYLVQKRILNYAEYGIFLSLILLVVCYFGLRIFYPYLFGYSNFFNPTINKDFAAAIEFQNIAQNGGIMFPPQWQWVNTPAYLFPLKNIVLWEMGLGLGVLVVIALFWYCVHSGFEVIRWIKAKTKKIYASPFFIFFVFAVCYFGYSGGKFAKNGRYFLLIFVPAIMIAAFFLSKLKPKFSKTIIFIVLVIQVLWAFSFVSIYSKDTTRVAASKWMAQNIPSGSTITIEHWDDALPYNMPPGIFYKQNEMKVFDDDNDKKIQALYDSFSSADYITLSSARAKFTVGRLPEIFPYMVRYYQKLDSGKLGVQLVNKTYSYPSLFGIEINDEAAEESFWVYDHPSVWIYKKVRQLSFDEFKYELTHD